jgi:hypothetical protein
MTQTAQCQVEADTRGIVCRARAALAAGDNNSWAAADAFLELSRLGWSVRKIAAACDTNKSSVARFIACARRFPVPVMGQRPRFWDAFQVVTAKSKAHVSQATGEDSWYTPPAYTAAARDVLGTITLDPASSAKANETVQATRYYTAEEDGLGKPWEGKLWMNPPYHAVERFAAKLIADYQSGAVREALLLVNNATETAWFQATARVSTALCLPAGRISFLDAAGEPKKQPLQGQAILYFGPDVGRFIQRFAEFGLCVQIGTRT